MSSLGNLLKQTTDRLAKAGVDTARLDARVLICHAAEIELSTLIGFPEKEVSKEVTRKLEEMVLLRELRKPVSQILGEKEFWSLDFIVTEKTLTPRPDTETLIDHVLKEVSFDDDLAILDLGTGTGCILLTLLSELPKATGVGVDISPEALSVAKENARRLGLLARATLIQSHWFDQVEGFFDIIVSNPPYIPAGDIAGLEKEVAVYEPILALAGGDDGLDCYRAIIGACDPYLKPGGLLGFEIGEGQDKDLKSLLEQAGFEGIYGVRDLAEITRCIFARKKV